MHVAHAKYRGADADDELIARYAPLIDRTARRIVSRTGATHAYDDLWSAGAMGLLDAARRYREGREVRFESFVEHRVKGAMLDELRKLDHLPRRLRAQTERANKARRTLAGELGRAPADDEVAARLGIAIEELHDLDTAAAPLVPLDPDMLLRDLAGGADEEVERRQLVAQMKGAVAGLPDRLQTLLSLYYVEDLTYREIATVMDVSQPRVCQLHAQAMELLREKLGAAAGGQVR